MKSRLVLGLLLIFWLYTPVNAVEWFEPEKIPCENRFLINLAVDNTGVCWCEGWPWMYSYRNDEQGWQPEIELDSIHWGTPCFDKSNVLWLLRENSDISYTRYNGQTWSEVDSVPVYPSWNSRATYTADSSGGVWVAWNTDWWFYWVVAYNRYSNGSWDEPRPLTDTMNLKDDRLYSMSTDALGRVWVGWYPLAVSYYDGNDWSEKEIISTVAGTELDLSPDREGGMWALWDRVDTTASPLVWRYYILASHWNGMIWSHPDTVAFTGRFAQGAKPYGNIAVDAEGNAWAVWRQAITEPYDVYGDIYYSVNTGSGWSEPAPVNEHPAKDIIPDIAVDGEGRVWCVWGSNREGEDEYDYSIWASYTKPSGVEEPVTPATPQPILTVDKGIGSSFTFRVSNLNSPAQISIYDASGKKVRILPVNSDVVTWDGRDKHGVKQASGVYFVRFTTNEYQTSRKMVLVK
ncbi:T9SS type A sorting domain-containing protein [candidate division WOR-3 bacterium]|uniref:T9SS type A sorting domain-containing protein n=1 Tax=candidate division WOR-3 bacterium TaxID=2052148 RepID=A0A9D5QCP8_UNCW3|nr:T9SS type A sorting domain-containing protein [candidate division WOR-3 bacterium]MBD3364272.1 T9SS type A sorting domain-containing protein [candidate division WOR-3 bacterium]